MPARRREPDREAIEVALGPELREALYIILDGEGIDRDGWHRIPALLQAWARPAATRVVAEIEEGGGTAEQGLAAAARRFRIPAETLRTWYRRWRDGSTAPVSGQNEPTARREAS